MKVLVLCSPTQEKIAREIMESSSWEDLDFKLVLPEKSWSLLDSQQLLNDLHDSSHMLIFPDEDNLASQWLPFALGYSMGRNRNIYLFGSLDTVILPAWMRELPKCQDLGELKTYYQEEVLRWNQKIQKEEARQAITDGGYALSEQAFSERVAEGDRTMTQLYLKAGFSPDSRDDVGIPLLCTAVRKRHKMLIPLLLNHGSDVDAQDTGRLNSPLMDAAADGLDDFVTMLLKAGANPDLISRNGQTALILAVGQGHSGSAELLINAGADVSVVDKLGMTAMKYAKLFKNEKIIRLIEEHP